MTPVRRWLVVALGVLALIAAPIAVAAWPVDDPDVSAEDLVERMRAATDRGYSGYVESVGGIALPVTDDFTDVAELLGGTNRLRVWWRGDGDWRVDRLEPAGEIDLFADGALTTTWDYEALRATRTAAEWAFLPRSVDLLPPLLAERLLDGATSEEVSRLPAERIAGRVAPGLRLTPAAPQASVDHVDIWVDDDTGLPLKVEVWGPAGPPAVSTEFVDFSLEPPPAGTTNFVPPPGITEALEGPKNVADPLSVGVALPDRLAGLSGRVVSGFELGRYGTGATQLAVAPLEGDVAEALREQLGDTTGAVVDRFGTRLAAGPMRVLLTPCGGDHPSWLLVGTVTEDTITTAAEQVLELPQDPLLAGIES